jgi:hypothetical protein
VLNINGKEADDENAIGEMKMEDYKDTFNMFVGTTNKTIDLFDNDYVSFKIYELTEEYVPYISPSLKFKKCVKSDLLEFVSEYATGYYPNALCLDYIDDFRMYSNWFNPAFINPMLTLERCNN